MPPIDTLNGMIVQFIFTIIGSLFILLIGVIVGISKYIRGRVDKRFDDFVEKAGNTFDLITVKVENQGKEMTEIKYNYMNRFADIQGEIREFETRMIKEFQDLKALLATEKGKLDNLIEEHNYRKEHK